MPNHKDECASSESHGSLTEFLSELSSSLQVAIQLRYLDGLTISEAAKALKVLVAIFKARLWQACTQLKRKLREP